MKEKGEGEQEKTKYKLWFFNTFFSYNYTKKQI